MTPMFIHFEATEGPEPYLLSVELEAGPNTFKTILRPPVLVKPPKGLSERELYIYGFNRDIMLQQIEGMVHLVRTVVLFDRSKFLKVMDAEIKRKGFGYWGRKGIQFSDLKDKVECMPNVPERASLEEATAILLGAPQDNLEGIKRLHAHKEIQKVMELV